MTSGNDAINNGESEKSRALDEKINDSLLAFIDFLYAIVFSLMLEQAYSGIIMDNKRTYADKGTALALMSGIFYFLCWDWLHGRLLMLRNPLKQYRRFFMEILIAFAGYGAALLASAGNANFLLCIAFIFVIGVIWANITIAEHPATSDMPELQTIKSVQPTLAATMFLVYLFMRHYGFTLDVLGVRVALLALGWLCIFAYEVYAKRTLTGINAGPGVPFVGRELIVKMKRKFERRPDE